MFACAAQSKSDGAAEIFHSRCGRPGGVIDKNGSDFLEKTAGVHAPALEPFYTKKNRRFDWTILCGDMAVKYANAAVGDDDGVFRRTLPMGNIGERLVLTFKIWMRLMLNDAIRSVGVA